MDRRSILATSAAAVAAGVAGPLPVTMAEATATKPAPFRIVGVSDMFITVPSGWRRMLAIGHDGYVHEITPGISFHIGPEIKMVVAEAEPCQPWNVLYSC